MKRISIGFYDEVYKELDEIKTKDGLQTIAQCVRELVDFAIRVRSAAEKAGDKKAENEVLLAVNELKNLLKSNLIWALEARLLARHLVGNIQLDSEEQKADNLEKYRNSATSYVQGLYGEKVE